MKNLLLILLLFPLFMSAQIRGKETEQNATVKYGQSKWYYTGIASDTTGVLDSTQYKIVLIETLDKVICDVYVDVDSVSGTGSVANGHYFILQGKQFPDDPYTAIDTVTYAGTVDTTFTLTSTSAAKYVFWKVLEKGKTDSFGTELKKLYFQFSK